MQENRKKESAGETRVAAIGPGEWKTSRTERVMIHHDQ
jgi:hypothetical protein